MRTVEILEMKSKGKPEESRRDKAETEKIKQQPRFFCSNCNHEIFLCMAYCDECGGEIAWQEKYKFICAKKKEPKKND